MAIVIFGGDRLGNIPDLLEAHGFELVQHVTGRKKGDFKAGIPLGVDGVLVLTDFLNHTLALEVKAAAKKHGIRTVYAKRSWPRIKEALDALQT